MTRPRESTKWRCSVKVCPPKSSSMTGFLCVDPALHLHSSQQTEHGGYHSWRKLLLSTGEPTKRWTEVTREKLGFSSLVTHGNWTVPKNGLRNNFLNLSKLQTTNITWWWQELTIITDGTQLDWQTLTLTHYLVTPIGTARTSSRSETHGEQASSPDSGATRTPPQMLRNLRASALMSRRMRSMIYTPTTASSGWCWLILRSIWMT